MGVTRRIGESCRGAGFHSPGRDRKTRTRWSRLEDRGGGHVWSVGRGRGMMNWVGLSAQWFH